MEPDRRFSRRCILSAACEPLESRTLLNAGDLDPSFGDAGRVLTDVLGSTEAANALAIQTDQNILVAGTAAGQFAILRYAPNGAIDTNFGPNGLVRTNMLPDTATGSAQILALALQTDHKIVAAGYVRNDLGTDDFALARYFPDGSLDTSFGPDGRVVTDFGADERALALTIQPDGRIVVVGGDGTNSIVARYTDLGLLDTSFNSTGHYSVKLLDGGNLHAVALQSNQQIIAVGSARSPASSDDFAILRLNTNGIPDLAFGDLGHTLTTITSGSDIARALAILSNDQILVGGSANGDFAAVRYNSTGTLDSSFAPTAAGKFILDASAGGLDTVTGLAVQSDDQIILAGTATFTGHSRIALTRISPSGAPDVQFGGNGLTTVDFLGADVTGQALALQANGRIVIAGTSTDNIAVARFLHDNTLVDVIIPTGTVGLNVPPPTPGPPTFRFVVTYHDNDAIDPTSLDNLDLVVNGPGFHEPATYISGALGTGNNFLATYQIPAPGGSWNSDDNATYSVNVQPGQVADASGNFVFSASIGTFTVNIVPDTTPPTATVVAANVSAGGATQYFFNVKYFDDGVINPATLDDTDIVVSRVGGGFSAPAQFVSATPAQGVTPATATYRIVPPGGLWNPDDNADYQIQIQPSSVFDTGGNAVPAGVPPTGTFTVNITPDNIAPSATLLPDPITTPLSAYTFTLTYTDNLAINDATIDSLDIVVSRPSGPNVPVIFLYSGGSPTARTATYLISPPTGLFNPALNGTWTISLQPSQVTDLAGNPVPAASFNLTVNIPTSSLAATILTVIGTDANDTIVLSASGSLVVVTVNGVTQTYPKAQVKRVFARGLGGNDSISMSTLGLPSRLEGDSGDDTLTGGPGPDTLVGGQGADILSGGAGRGDTADYSDRSEPLSLTLDNQPNDGADGEGDSIAADVENLIGGEGDDTLLGNASTNRLVGNDGNDSIDGGAGNDTLDGGQGSDTLAGGAGKDLADYSTRTQRLIITINDIANDGAAGENDNVRFDIENLAGGQGNDSITGSPLDNSITGGAGNDTLHGGGGNDSLDGGPGKDQLYGDAGDDRLYAKDGAGDTVIGGPGKDKVKRDPMDQVSKTEGLLA